jgi:hypothetical protein
MITDKQTNTVYFSDLLFEKGKIKDKEAPYIGTLEKEYNQLIRILDRHEISMI